MHTPIFVEWIISHNQPAEDGHPATALAAPCLICSMKSLAIDYWLWEGTSAQNILYANHVGLQDINAAALAAHPATFANGRPGDAGIFYDWLTDQMGYTFPPGPIPVHQTQAIHWNNELKAMFQLDIKDTRTCNNCGAGATVAPIAQVRAVEVDFDPARNSLDEMLENDFFQRQPALNCVACGGIRHHNTVRTIIAAPQVLRIRVNIVHTVAGGQTTKYLNGWGIPYELDLTANQANDRLPLTYTLSSAIAHREDGGKIYDQQPGGTIVLPAVEDEAMSDHVGIAGPVNGRDFGPERADSVMDEDEVQEEGLEPRRPRDMGTPFPITRHVAGGNAARVSPGMMQDFDGLIEVTTREFIEELGPSMDSMLEDMPDAPNGEDDGGEDEDEDPRELRRSDESWSLPSHPDSDDDDFFGHQSPTPSPQGSNEGNSNGSEPDGNDGDDNSNGGNNGNDQGFPVEQSKEDSLNDDVENEPAMYNDDGEPIAPDNHYILNAHGPDDAWHISMSHHSSLYDLDHHAEEVNSNPQRPWHRSCFEPQGYQVVTLTYLRNPLEKKWRKMEKDIPAFI
jgi:hypothetical protein